MLSYILVQLIICRVFILRDIIGDKRFSYKVYLSSSI